MEVYNECLKTKNKQNIWIQKAVLSVKCRTFLTVNFLIYTDHLSLLDHETYEVAMR
jgi:hypothetical protein